MMTRDKLGRYVKGSVNPNKGIWMEQVCCECNTKFNSKVRKKYCSVPCREIGFKKNATKVWHSEKRLKYLISDSFMKHQKDISRSNEKHHSWKGDKVGYVSIHTWVARNLGKANHCSFNSNHKSTCYHWANISGNYMRDTDDYASLCPACHWAYDSVVKKNIEVKFVRKNGKYERNNIFQ